MAELMAFVVLSLPILAVLLIVVLAVLAARVAARRMAVPEKKWKAAVIAALAVILIPTWDEVAGRLYFHYLCTTQGGVKVFNREELQPQYWGSNGIPKDRIVRVGSRFEMQIGDRYYIETQAQKNYSQTFRIDREHQTIRDRESDNVLSELVAFRHWGGWLVNNTALNVTAKRCPDPEVYKDFYRRTFVKKTHQ